MNALRAAIASQVSAPAIVRVPTYFGRSDAELFGWYHAPAGDRPPTAAVVICPPLGHEYINSHRSLRHLADRLADLGMAALRFDYAGTGDSAGDGHDADRLAAWTDSIRQAIHAMRARVGRAELVVLGLRMGALLAAGTTSDVDVGSLVLWAPCTRGRTFIRELKALAGAAGQPSAASGSSAGVEAAGFVVSETVQRDIEGLNLAALAPRARRILVADRDDIPEGTALLETWTARGLQVDHQLLPGYADMVLAPHNTVVPQEAIDYITGWIVAGTAKPDPGPRDGAAGLADSRGHVLIGNVKESFVRFGDRGEGFGIVSEPVAMIDASAPAVVFANAGSVHHIGPNGLYVQLARALAQEGFRCMRIDLPGLGDSVSDDAARENVPYPPDATRLIGSALEAWSREADIRRVVLAGLCSGAHASFHAAADLDDSRVVESLLINPLTFAYRPGMSLDTASEPRAVRWQRYRSGIGNVRKWSKLFGGEIGLRTIAADVVARVGSAVTTGIAAARARVARSAAAAGVTDLERKLRRLTDRGGRLTLVCSEFDPGYDLLMTGAGRHVKALQKKGQASFWFIKGANHTFDKRVHRDELVECVTRALSARYFLS